MRIYKPSITILSKLITFVSTKYFNKKVYEKENYFQEENKSILLNVFLFLLNLIHTTIKFKQS